MQFKCSDYPNHIQNLRCNSKKLISRRSKKFNNWKETEGY